MSIDFTLPALAALVAKATAITGTVNVYPYLFPTTALKDLEAALKSVNPTFGKLVKVNAVRGADSVSVLIERAPNAFVQDTMLAANGGITVHANGGEPIWVQSHRNVVDTLQAGEDADYVDILETSEGSIKEMWGKDGITGYTIASKATTKSGMLRDGRWKFQQTQAAIAAQESAARLTIVRLTPTEIAAAAKARREKLFGGVTPVVNNKRAGDVIEQELNEAEDVLAAAKDAYATKESVANKTKLDKAQAKVDALAAEFAEA